MQSADLVVFALNVLYMLRLLYLSPLFLFHCWFLLCCCSGFCIFLLCFLFHCWFLLCGSSFIRVAARPLLLETRQDVGKGIFRMISQRYQGHDPVIL